MDALIVVDSAPVVSPGQGTFQKFIAAMKAIKFESGETLPQARRRANKELEEAIPVRYTYHFLRT
jgi:hypothetical protein